MANEITVQCAIQAAKGGAVINSTGTNATASVTFDMTGTDMVSGTITTASGSTAALTPTGVTAPYYLFIRNMSSATAESIRFGNANANPITSFRTTVPAGRSQLLYVETSGAVYYHSDSGTPQFFYAACEA